MKVVITETAKNDLIEIGEFIRIHNARRAASFIDELLNRCDGLGDMPNLCPLVPRYEHHKIRRCVYRNYLIFYRVKNEIVQVIHILQGARDYDRLLFDIIMTEDY